jgi:hypothetical protein
MTRQPAGAWKASSGRLAALASATVLACLAATGGCSSVLGLDAPTLDPCAGQACADATAEGSIEAGTEGAVEVGTDAAADGDAGPPGDAGCIWDGEVPFDDGAVRCGGGCFAPTSCSGATPVCCQTQDATGELTFTCAASEAACSGYSIDCVNENDCSGNGVCCHYSTHTICATSCTGNQDIACLPGSADDCPAGKKCDVVAKNGDAAVPYYLCEP